MEHAVFQSKLGVKQFIYPNVFNIKVDVSLCNFFQLFRIKNNVYGVIKDYWFSLYL